MKGIFFFLNPREGREKKRSQVKDSQWKRGNLENWFHRLNIINKHKSVKESRMCVCATFLLFQYLVIFSRNFSVRGKKIAKKRKKNSLGRALTFKRIDIHYSSKLEIEFLIFNDLHRKSGKVELNFFLSSFSKQNRIYFFFLDDLYTFIDWK